MKKSIILSVLGLTAAAVSSYGQGSVAFDTYSAGPGSAGIQTTYGAGTGQAGTGIGSTFTGELLWSSVNIPDVATTANVLQGTALTSGWNVGLTTKFDIGNAAGATGLGYISDPNNYTLTLTALQNPGTTVYLEIVAFTGASYASTGFSGHSASFVSSLVSGTTLPSGQQLNNLLPFSVYTVVPSPEPTTLALAGLGGLASLVALRRKQA